MIEKPKLFEKKYYKHRFYYVIRFDLKYDDDLNDWKWYEVKLPYGVFDYSSIVNAIVSFKYPQDKMQAIINNYLLDPEDPAVVSEFNDMQEWRKYSKSYAKEILK